MTTRKTLLFLCLLLLICSGIIAAKKIRHNAEVKAHQAAGEVYVDVHTFRSDDGWGYDIVTDGKTYIHQQYIPVIAGKHSFKTEEQALAAGHVVLQKILKHQVPAMTREDLKTLGITDAADQIK